MRTSVEISDSLLREAKAVAAEKGIPLRDLVESGLRHAIHELRSKKFKLRDCSFRGNGLARGVRWEALLDAVYERTDDYEDNDSLNSRAPVDSNSEGC